MENKDRPFVTLIIAMRNEEGYISGCLESVKGQDYPKEKLEVIVFDGQSTDRSWQIAAGFKNTFEHFRLLPNPKVIQSAAWNIGIKIAKGSVIGIVSAHSELSPDYVSKAVEVLLRTQADMVGGPTLACTTGPVASAIAAAMNSPFGVGGANFHYTEKEVATDTVFMGVCWRSLYEKIGGFDEEMIRNQDDEFSYRLRENGGKIVCSPTILSRYFSRSTLSGLWKQYFHYGYYKVRVLQKHPYQMRPRQFVPFAFIGSLFLSLLLSLVFSWGWAVFGLVIGAYLLANLAASVWTSAHKDWAHLIYLSVSYTILHVSYGLGFWVGLFKFGSSWGNKKGVIPNIEPHHVVLDRIDSHPI